MYKLRLKEYRKSYGLSQIELAHAFQEEKNKTIESIDALFDNSSQKRGS